jgi:hypothetical protein
VADRHPQRRRSEGHRRRHGGRRDGVGRLNAGGSGTGGAPPLHDDPGAGPLLRSRSGGDAALHSEAAPDSGSVPVCSTPTADLPSTVGPVRTCVGCRTRSSADGLLRVVVVHGALTPDPRRRLPGRGAWLHPVPECLDRAERRSAFPRALRVPGPLDVTAVRMHVTMTGRTESTRTAAVPARQHQ